MIKDFKGISKGEKQNIMGFTRRIGGSKKRGVDQRH